MQNIYELNTIMLLGVKVDDGDLEVIASTLLDAAQKHPHIKLEKYLRLHWKNLLNCLEMAASNDSFLLASREEVFREASYRDIVDVMVEKGDFIHTWAGLLKYEIERGRLHHFKAFKEISIEKGSLFAKINGYRYAINRKKMERFFRVAHKRVQTLNKKAFSCIREFVKWSYNHSQKPWLSPLFFGIIILLVLFTVSVLLDLSIVFGVLEILYRAIYIICILCFLGYSTEHILSVIGLARDK